MASSPAFAQSACSLQRSMPLLSEPSDGHVLLLLHDLPKDCVLHCTL